jgi:hypothetical protein
MNESRYIKADLEMILLGDRHYFAEAVSVLS